MLAVFTLVARRAAELEQMRDAIRASGGRAEALALCALCVRLSERAADPAIGALPPPLDWATDTSDDIACLRARLSPARCAALQAWWLTPEEQQLLGPFHLA